MTVFKFPYTPSCEPRLSAGVWIVLATFAVPMACGEGRATLAVQNRAAVCFAAGGGISENLL